MYLPQWTPTYNETSFNFLYTLHETLLYNYSFHFRIDKDVQRCDRNLSYFTDKNLEKLRNVITTYVWENLDIGYMQVYWIDISYYDALKKYIVIWHCYWIELVFQGMCDLAGPLLVVFDDESITHSCFARMMERMIW